MKATRTATGIRIGNLLPSRHNHVNQRLKKRSLSNQSSSQNQVKVTRHLQRHKNEASSPVASPPLDLYLQATTRLVDDLLATTRQLMGSDRNIPQHLIAFSGGVDSSLAAALVNQSHDASMERVQAVLGISPAVPTEQVDLAERVAEHLGIDFLKVPTTEGQDETYLANEGKACLACKTHLYSTLQAIVQHGENAHNSFRLYNGTNADDRQDPTRLGLVAARDFHVQSPLRDLTKDQVRHVARHLGLFNWNYAASPCLRSRLALGVTATAQHLELMARAERMVRQRLGDRLVDETTNLRVRLLAGHRVRIEIDEPLVDATLDQDWSDLQTIGGFADVSVQAFRSGSVARKEPLEDEDLVTTAIG